MTISSTSNPSSRKKPRSLATKKGIEVVLLAAKPIRIRASLSGFSAEKASNAHTAERTEAATKNSTTRGVEIIVSSSQSDLSIRRFFGIALDVLHEPFQLLVRLRANHQVTSREKRRHGVDAIGGAAAPVLVDGILVLAAKQ